MLATAALRAPGRCGGGACDLAVVQDHGLWRPYATGVRDCSAVAVVQNQALHRHVVSGDWFSEGLMY